MSDLIEGLKSCVMMEVLHHRNQDGGGVLDSFASHVNEHRERYLRKSADPSLAQQVNALADDAIARARDFGISLGAFGGGAQ